MKRPNKHRKSSCAGKYRYRTDQEAQLEIERAAQLRGETLRAYTCPICQCIHLTSMTLEHYRRRSTQEREE